MTTDDLPTLRSKLSAAKLGKLEERLQRARSKIVSGQSGSTDAIARRPDRATAPLSFAQSRLWFLEQLEPGTPLYNIPVAVRLSGQLDTRALSQTLSHIVDRHQALRTTFSIDEAGKPEQRIEAAREVSLPVVDLSAPGMSEREEEAQRLAKAEARRPFDLVSGPLFRALLLRLSAHEHVILLTIHHIVSDAWSIGVLIREIGELYAAFTQGRPSPLRELEIQYADFAVWQRDWLSGEVLEQQLAYWKQQLGGDLPTLQMPTVRRRPSRLSNRGAQQSIALPREVLERLQDVGRSEDATLFMTLFAAFNVLLYRYTGQDDILVGTPVANRNRPQLEPLVGFFVNTLVLRTRLSGARSFRQLLRHVRESALGAFDHQDVPFEKLVQELQPERDLSRQPLFQAMFVLQNTQPAELHLPGLIISPMSSESGTSKFDLTLAMIERGGGELRAEFEYSTDLFDAPTITRMLDHLRRLLEGIAADANEDISKYELLTEAERRQLSVEWNEQEARFAPANCLHQIFERRVESAPDAVAVSFEDRHLTYRELNARSNQLANRLRAMSVGPEVLVGICMQRSMEMIVGMLGIWKAGGAYLPIDPDYPEERRAFMLRDGRASILLTQQALVGRMMLDEVEVLCLDSDWEEIALESAANPDSGAQPCHTAYVIYTSGSTGQPKGVMITHANVARLFEATDSHFSFNAQDVWTMFHSHAFDFSVWEIWGALLYGGRLVIVPYLVSRTPAAFYHLLCAERVTVLNQTPTAFRQLMRAEETLGDSTSHSLRLIIFGGEALELQSLKPWFDRHDERLPRLVNMYGITETTVHVTYRPLTKADLSAAAGSMVGRPLRDLQTYILDRHAQPVPVGVAGEICIGGDGLARGYLNHPSLTAERFVPNPFGARPGTRLYRSGDLARFSSGGDIEYLGRIDQQVKISGFRIETGEIESVLNAHPGVRESVLLLREDSPGEKRLVAYVVADGAQALVVTELRRHLAAMLPAYMLPSDFVLMDKLPLTTNGKVNRRALPPPASFSSETNRYYLPPQNELQLILTNIWEEVLGVVPVGIDDNFFSLGGDSIRVVQIAHRASAYNLTVTALDVFQYPTVAELAQRVSASPTATEKGIPHHLREISEPLRASLPVEVEDIYPATQMQEFMLRHYADDTERVGFYHAQQWFHLYDDSLSLSALKDSLWMLVRKHPALRTFFIKDDSGQTFLAVRREAQLSFKEDDISHLDAEGQEAFIEATIRQDRARAFDADSMLEPLCRFYALVRSEKSVEFLMSIHHAVDDGWGNVEFLKELFQTYEALKKGARVNLSPAIDSFKEFVGLEQEILASNEARDFWRAHLKDECHKSLKPVRSIIDASAERALSYNFKTDFAAGLRLLARSLKVSLKTILLSAYLDLLSSMTGQRTATAGVVSNGRSERLSEPFKSLGLFWNIVPFCCAVIDAKDAQLRMVQQSLIDVETYARYPLPRILLDQNRDELFFATFNFLHFHNSQPVSASPGVQLLGADSFDKFHFPLNYTVSVNPFDGQMSLRVEFLQQYFDRHSVESQIDNYLELLKGYSGGNALKLEHSSVRQD